MPSRLCTPHSASAIVPDPPSSRAPTTVDGGAGGDDVPAGGVAAAGVAAAGGHFEVPFRAGRVLALDLGERRIGIAVSDSQRLLASPRTVLVRSGDLARDRERIAEAVGEEGATELVVGLPLSLDGSLGPAARLVLAEVEKIRAVVTVPVTTWDERLTTVEAVRRRQSAAAAGGTGARGRAASRGSGAAVRRSSPKGLRAQPGGPRDAGGARKRAVVDDQAAAILLQAFLDAHRDEATRRSAP